MNLHERHKPRWPYLTIEERRKLLLTLIVAVLLAWATLVALA